MNLVNPGVYEAKIVNYGLSRSKSGNLQAVVKLGFEDDMGKKHTISWYGGFGPNQMRMTIGTLVVCGLNTAVDAIAEGPSSNALNTVDPLFIEVEHNEYQGKTNARIRWISKSSLGSQTSISRDAAKEQLSVLGADQVLKELLTGSQESSGDFGDLTY